MGFFSKISEGLKKTRDSLNNAVSGMLAGFRKVDEELFEELEEILVMSDIGVATARKLCDELREEVKLQKIEDPASIKTLLEEKVAALLAGSEGLRLDTQPSVILVIGVNGAGKTTTIGKLAASLKADGKRVILGAADTFRAAAIEQLGVWAERAGVEMIRGSEGGDPASVVFDTIAAARARGADVILCDTAGRLHNKKNLMEELAKISRIIHRELPDASVETLLVLDATTGQNAVNQAREFKTAADITGIVLTKLDGTARGGVVLSIYDELGIPVKLIGVGEQIDDLQPFDPDDFARAMFRKSEETQL
ncbi:MAG: signal recognition particle-docking protein FtsY [Candidatus Howiella sp.]|jgi:fused signal recognition particle receptor